MEGFINLLILCLSLCADEQDKMRKGKITHKSMIKNIFKKTLVKKKVVLHLKWGYADV